MVFALLWELYILNKKRQEKRKKKKEKKQKNKDVGKKEN